MPQPLTAEALETPKTRQGAKVLPLHEEQPSRPAPVTSGTPEPGDALDDMAEILDRGVHAGIAPPDLRPVACGARRRLSRLGRASRFFAGQAGAAIWQGAPQMGAPWELCPWLLRERGTRRALHRPAAPGPALFRRGVAGLALQLPAPELPPSAAMVAQRDNRCGRGHEATRERQSSSPPGRSST